MLGWLRTQGQKQSVSGYMGSQENLLFEIVWDIFDIVGDFETFQAMRSH